MRATQPEPWQGQLNYWLDTRIEPSAIWPDEIEAAADRAARQTA